jgi:tRNA(Ile)-lysidine synthase
MSALDPEQIVRALEPLGDAPRVWVACSGGLDSTALLHAAASVRERLPGRLRAVHIDHGLHPQSGCWAEHCRIQCESLGVPLITRALALAPVAGESPEAVAREARYRAFVGLLGAGDLLLTAHHQDDQAETLLLALIRGSGVQGLAAMPLVASLGEGRLVRPLLGTPRDAISRYAADHALDWVEDPSNASPAPDRNYLRHRVLPMMRQRWPAVSRTMARSAGHCADAAALADQSAASVLPGLEGQRPGTLSIPALLDLDPALRKSVLRLWLRGRGFLAPDTRHLMRILDEVLVARRDASPLVAWRGCEVRRYRGDLFALRPLPAPPDGRSLPWSAGTLVLPEPLGQLERPASAADRPPGDRTVRFGVTGLGCRYQRGGRTKPLKGCFQELGVPPWIRPYVPLVFAGERLTWVGGVGACLDAGDLVGDLVGDRILWRGHPWESLGWAR